MNSKDVKVGAKFGRWTVLEIGVYDPNSKAKQKVKKALCQCECGTIRYKEYRDLYTLRYLSCGCLRSEQVRERNLKKGEISIGTVYGKLTVIQDLGCRKQASRDKQERWSLCKCECGNLIEVRNNNLKSGQTQSCGCVQSRGERIITELLLKNNIEFKTQYTFPDLKSEKGALLKFDFAIFKNNELIQLIEFDGRQHFFGPDGTWKNSDNKETIQARDQLKNLYCQNNNIKLIRIPYTEIGNITLKTLGLS